MTIPPSGAQHEISFGSQHAVIVEVGGGIRAYTDGGREVLEPYAAESVCDGGHGAPLVPWPNRIGDGRYRFGGEDYQLALSDPATRTAIHGLLRWSSWQAQVVDPDRVVMSVTLHPQPGYPFMLEVSVDYRLGVPGLTVTTTATNRGARTCPYGTGQHPYLSTRGHGVDACALRLGAATRIVTDPERQLPIGRAPVAGTPYDFRRARRIGALRLDTAFTDLERDEGCVVAELTDPDGVRTLLWADAAYHVIQVFTGDSLSSARRRTGLAIEPMTMPADAFRSGEHLTRLEPGQTTSSSWGVRLDAGR